MNHVLTLLCSGEGWSQLDPVVASELLSQIQEGEFWVDEEEFFREFDEITVGFPVNEEGQLQSLYTGVVWKKHLSCMDNTKSVGKSDLNCK